MDAPFWAALTSGLAGLGTLLTVLAQRLKVQRAKAATQRAEAATQEALLQAQLDKERKEAAERERLAAAEALEFRERLRQEAIAERGILEESIADLAAAVNRNTEVMERTIDVVEHIIARPGTATRPPPRRSGTASSRCSGRVSGGNEPI